jgi:integrase/recombinase XerD
MSDEDVYDVEIYEPGDLVIDTGTDWGHYVEAWLTGFDSRNTAKAYRSDEAQWRTFCAEKGIDPLTVRRIVLDLWKQELTRAGGYAGRPAAPKTINRKLSAVASLYAYLVTEGVLETSPAAHIKRPNVSDSYQATASLDEEQAARVLDAAEQMGAMEYAAIRILMFSGIRADELVNTCAEDVRTHHGSTTVTVTRKGGKRQEIPLSPETGAFMLEHLAGRTSGPVIHGVAGAALDYWDLYYICTKAGRRAKVGLPTPPHVFRATFATTYLNSDGAQFDRLQDVMGHADGRTTKLYDRGSGALGRMAGVMSTVEARINAARNRAA